MNEKNITLLVSIVIITSIIATYVLVKKREIEKFANNKYFTHISAGSRHTVILNNNQNIYSCGYNNKGRLGTGDTTHVIAPIKILAVENYTILNIFAGNTNTFYLIKKDNNICVYASGDNTNDVMGLGQNAGLFFHEPVEIPFFTTNNIVISKVSPGWNHTLFLTTTGKVYACGNNNVGQLGTAGNLIDNLTEFNSVTETKTANINDTTPRKTPTLIEFFNDKTVNDISAKGYGHSLFLTNDAKVYSCGWNWYGQLGIGNNKNYFTPTLINFFNNINIHKIESAMAYSLFISDQQVVYACGNNKVKLFGIGNEINETSSPKEITFFSKNATPIKIKDVFCGAEHVMFLTIDNKIYGCGINNQGQLGTENTNDALVPTEITYFKDNNLIVENISVGAFHTVFLTSDGIVFVCGNNSAGQLGIGDMAITYSSTPIKCDIPIDQSKTDMTYKRSFGIVD